MKAMHIDDVLSRAHVVSLPLAVKFRGITTREALLIEGPAGWGEFSPFLEYGPAESAHWLAAGLEAAYEGFPEPVRDLIEVNGTIPAVPASEVPAVMECYPGCRTFKIKVAEKGQTLADDIARVTAVRNYITERGRVPVLRVDANGGWSVEQAVEAAKALMPLDYMEQPCASAEELAEVRRQLMRNGLFVRVAADESIRKVEDPYRVADLQAADVAVVKPAPLGGVRRVLDVAKHLRSRHMDITVASALDTSVGIGMGLATVAALPKILDDEDVDVTPAAAGLATGSLFLEDVTEPRQLIDGHLAATPLPPDPARLSGLAAAPERRDWWFARVRECWQFL
ncbi:O-succinylbenzoate synthase [Corynebacterium sp. HMSC06D04]|uniref:o-succinylbenzoate synthase n=1 Tax=Corynebacterium simulans TaxID=146827 RepID=A0ABR5VBE1_9CORY|nr:mandelate racemase / muconate lactonizing enzyme, C-terminal domain protein [Corynebacterium simulans]OFL98549.1 O-succinylbenzoate synthase [Corynebacterium sp. HMSC071F07]OFR40547.1 O-succinylbenzoate synthase [Corynebacterium sp. HMSC077D03]OFT52557.1 O-succinylbenzoate synthase [Corynebacterium sp. HMSC06D04]OHO67757.1 O-succinylbenzoate synthase [Corynebacterium sp. HMSC036D03]